MGVGMQMFFRGFPGSCLIESEASAQLVRIERFGGKISGCTLTLQALPAQQHAGPLCYAAQLDLIALNGALLAMRPCADEDPLRAVEAAFDAAEIALSRGGRLPHVIF